METKALQRDRGNVVMIATACLAMALWAAACGGGGGTAVVPVSIASVSLPSAPIDFGSVPVGTASPLPGSATLTNVGNATLSFTNIEVMGTNPGDFTFTSGSSQNPCPFLGGTLVAGASCTISATFTPSAAGTRTATVVFTDNAANSPQQVTLTGTGTAPAVGLSATALTFGSQLVGTSAAAQNVIVTNNGNASLSISSIALTGANAADFLPLGGTCAIASPVAAGGSCTINVMFTPASSATTTRTATLTITDNAISGSQAVSLTGTGTSPAVSPLNGLTFTSVAQGTSSSQSVNLVNTGNATLTISLIAVVGVNASNFTLTSGSNPCPYAGGTVLAGASCTITVTFTPSSASATPFTASVVVTDNAPTSPQMIPLTGTGVGNSGVASLSSPSLTFGSQTVNTSTSMPVTLTNTGNANLNIASIAVMGATANDFTVPANPCSTPLAPQGNCTINVTFAPTPAVTGSLRATLVVTDDSGTPGVENSTQSVALSGTETASQVSLSATTLTFAGQNVGTMSAALPIILTNTGNVNLTITSISVAGTNAADFPLAATTTCPISGGSVAANNGTCTINVTFTPSAPLTRTAVVTITDNSNAGPTQIVNLTGTGIGPIVSLTATSLNFATQTLGTTSAVTPVTLTNTGNASLNITSLGLTGTYSSAFSLTGTTCSTATPVPAGGNCTIDVFFTPTTPGALTAQVGIADNATTGPSPSPQTVSLSGTGNGPVVNLSASALSYASSVPVGSTATLTLTLTNNGNASLNITNTQITGANAADFSVTNSTCGSSVAATSSCTMTVTFAPTAPGPSLAASLSITDNAFNSPQAVSLTGTGTAPVATPSNPNLNFPNLQNLGATSGALPVTLNNTGNATLNITSIGSTDPSEFTLANGSGQCPYTSLGTVAAGASCTIYVTFTPTASGPRTASLTITDNSNNVAGSQQSVTVTGTGSGPGILFSPSPLIFGSQTQGTPSTAQGILLTNSGNANLTITSSITVTGANSGDFTQTNTCGSLVTANGGTCTINVTFTPQALGTRTAAVSVTDNAPLSPQSVTLTGTGLAGLGLSSPNVTFTSPQNVGTTSTAQSVTITNTGTTSFTISGISLTGANPTDFSQTNSCTNATLGPGGICAIIVQFKPQAPGPLSASISIADSLTGSPQTVALQGTGLGPAVSLSGNVTFTTPQNVGTTSGAQPVTLTNVGNASLTINSINAPTGADPGDFSLSSGTGACTSGGTVSAGASCTIYVMFTPTAFGSRTALITISDNAVGSPQAFTLTGTGSAPVATISTQNLPNFGNQNLGTSTTQTFTLSNTGNAALTISGIVVGGANPGNFQTTTCGTSLAANGVCTITITFLPTAPGALTATVTITDNTNYAAGSTQIVSLTGAGNGPLANPSMSTLSFGSQTENVPATGQVTLSNPTPGNAPLNITSITVTGANFADFTLTSGTGACPYTGGTVTVGASCTIYVLFKPILTATENATVTITDNADPTTQTLTLQGTGTASVVSLSLSNWNFGYIPVTTPPTASSSLPVTLTNTGNLSLSITGISVGGTNPGDFSETNTCPLSPSSVAANGGSCTINVTFAPTASGNRTASISIADTATAGSPQAVALSGTGAVGTVELSTISLTFGSYSVGSTSQGSCNPTANPVNCITLTNLGNSALTINSFSIGGTNSGDFTINSTFTTCVGSLAINGSCVVDVTFQPTASGNRSATLTFMDSATSSPQMVALGGTGTAPLATFTNPPPPVAFSNQDGGITSAGQIVTLSNTGNAVLNISSTSPPSFTGTNPGDFAVATTTCGTTLAANADCTFSITFTPATAGSRSATFVVTDNSNNSAGATQTIALTGTGLHDVVLTWTASTSTGILGYNVYRSTTEGAEIVPPATPLNSTPISATTYADTNVTPGTTYCYEVTAVASDGILQSSASNEASATVPLP